MALMELENFAMPVINSWRRVAVRFHGDLGYQKRGCNGKKTMTSESQHV
jgi:hypothetical protein